MSVAATQCVCGIGSNDWMLTAVHQSERKPRPLLTFDPITHASPAGISAFLFLLKYMYSLFYFIIYYRKPRMCPRTVTAAITEATTDMQGWCKIWHRCDYFPANTKTKLASGNSCKEISMCTFTWWQADTIITCRRRSLVSCIETAVQTYLLRAEVEAKKQGTRFPSHCEFGSGYWHGAVRIALQCPSSASRLFR